MPPPRPLAVHLMTEPDRTNTPLLIRAYALVVPLPRRRLRPMSEPVRRAPDWTVPQEQAQ
jgi:hypothetical protein